jgi:hypothetical protein
VPELEIEITEAQCQAFGFAPRQVSIVLTGKPVSWGDPRENEDIIHVKPFDTQSNK